MAADRGGTGESGTSEGEKASAIASAPAMGTRPGLTQSRDALTLHLRSST